MTTMSRLQAAGSKEKLGVERRNPTILRKSNICLTLKDFTGNWNIKIFLISKFPELDMCIYLMSSIGIKMEVEEGASATSTELVRK